LQLSSGYWGQC